MTFYLDEDVTPAVAEALRRRGVDVESAHELGHHGWTDERQLAYSARRGHTFVTRNDRDFRGLGHRAIASQAPHAGIALFTHRITGSEISTMTDGLILLAELYPNGLGPYDVVYVPIPPEKP